MVASSSQTCVLRLPFCAAQTVIAMVKLLAIRTSVLANPQETLMLVLPATKAG